MKIWLLVGIGILAVLIGAYHCWVCDNYEKKIDAGREYWIEELSDVIRYSPWI